MLVKFFVKLNAVSAFYAFALFIIIELLVNVLRINRLTGWEIGTVNNLTTAVFFGEFIFGTILFIILTKKVFNGRYAAFWSIILWFPYLILFVFIFASLFPITYEGDRSNPVTGLVIMWMSLLYPVYLFFINLLGTGLGNKKEGKTV